MRHRFDFAGWASRISTWLAVMAACAAGALGAYAVMPERVQNLMPEWLLIALGAIAMGAAFLVPVATSFKQRPRGGNRANS
ncbi:hypothetical protein GGR77_001525 [Xanthomonas translucens]